ncbi:hypothetical protein BH23ACT11_BH23ACT11_23930 [soil metagenome]
MSTASLLLFVLAGAFVFAYRCHYTSYLATRMEGRQLVFVVTFIGVGLISLSRASLIIAPLIVPEVILLYIGRVWAAVVSPFQISALATYFGAFLWGPILAFVVNRFYGADRASTDAIERYGSEQEQLLFRAMQENSFVSVTLNNRKVYIGWPVYSPDTRRETKDFRLLPAVSGYRDEQTLDLHLTTQYFEILEKVRSGTVYGLNANDFEVMLPLENVVSVGLFSLAIDQKLFKIQSDDASEDERERNSVVSFLVMLLALLAALLMDRVQRRDDRSV